MAKALLGHVGGPDPRMVAEMRRLQRQYVIWRPSSYGFRRRTTRLRRHRTTM